MQVLFSSQQQSCLPAGIEAQKIIVRLEQYSSSMRHIRQLKSSSIGNSTSIHTVVASLCSMSTASYSFAGKIVTIKGTVVRISPVKPMVQSASFACSKCGSEQQMSFKEGIFALPTSCGEDGCRARTFTLLKKTAKSIDWQKIRVQVAQ